MNLPEILKQFKTIEPDPAYKERSKRMILSQTPKESWSFRRTILTIFETGIAVALSVFFILILTGVFPDNSYVSPAQFSVIDPASLKAEAQAVNIQIQLAQITYEEATATAESTLVSADTGTSAKPAIAPLLSETAAATSTPTTDNSTPTSSASSTPSSTLSIDQALKQLTK
jgi:hypothetical protein